MMLNVDLSSFDLSRGITISLPKPKLVVSKFRYKVETKDRVVPRRVDTAEV